MKKTLILLSLFLFSCAKNNKSDLIGIWKSNKEKTLESVFSIDGMPPKAVEFFEKYLGHMIVEFRENEKRTYFDNCEEDCDDENCIETVCNEAKKFNQYKIIKETNNHFIISYFDEFENKTIETTLYREANCYYLIITKYNIKEYFCKEAQY